LNGADSFELIASTGVGRAVEQEAQQALSHPGVSRLAKFRTNLPKIGAGNAVTFVIKGVPLAHRHQNRAERRRRDRCRVASGFDPPRAAARSGPVRGVPSRCHSTRQQFPRGPVSCPARPWERRARCWGFSDRWRYRRGCGWFGKRDDLVPGASPCVTVLRCPAGVSWIVLG